MVQQQPKSMILKRIDVNSEKILKRVAILGSTGSIGCSCLDIVRANIDKFKITALTAGKNLDLLIKQAVEFLPDIVAIADKNQYEELKERIKEQIPLKSITVLCGAEGIEQAITESDSHIFVLSIVGAAGVMPALAASKTGRVMALANKEALVTAGQFVMESAKKNNTRIIPVDSEHSAIFQCLESIGFSPDINREYPLDKVKRLIITASGGPFRDFSAEQLKGVTKDQALKHPNWDMGGKITIDSATLMNKGLEVIEAHWLFNMPAEKIDALIHPQSIIHSIVELKDGSMLSQMGVPDMKIPIQYALTWPERIKSTSQCYLDLLKIEKLSFSKIRRELFPCFSLAMRALELKGAAPAVLNAANESAVKAFLEESVDFNRIPFIIEKVMNSFGTFKAGTVSEVMDFDKEARQRADEELKRA